MSVGYVDNPGQPRSLNSEEVANVDTCPVFGCQNKDWCCQTWRQCRTVASMLHSCIATASSFRSVSAEASQAFCRVPETTLCCVPGAYTIMASIPADSCPLMQALSALPAAVTLFSPDKLRKALLSAGNIVQPEEVSAVLSYVTSDGRYEDLIGPHLILLQHGSVQQMQKNTSMAKKYFVFTNAKSETIYKLMEGNKDELVKEHSIWTTLAR